MSREEGSTASRGLNQFQQTALAVTLEQLERSVNEIEHMLDDTPAGAVYATIVDFQPDTLRRIRKQCQGVRRQIADMKAAFELPQRPSDARRIIVAEMSAAWAHLDDLRPSKLRRYGNVDPTLEQTLTPRLERLIHLVLTIEELACSGECKRSDLRGLGIECASKTNCLPFRPSKQS